MDGADSAISFVCRLVERQWSPEKIPHAYNKDGKPNARHSYWQPQFIDAANEFMAFGCTNEWETDSIKSLVVDSYSLNKGSWNAQGTNPAMPHRRGWDGNAQCKHSVTEDVFIAAGGYLSRWSRASNTWTDIRTVHAGMERGMMAVDPNANIILRLGLNAPSNPCFKFDCDTGAMTPGNLVGPYAAAVNLSDAPHWGASGFTYDLGLKAFLLYQNTGQIYVLTPSGSDWNVDLLPTSGTLPEINADMSAALGGGIWGRFAYVPALKGVVYVSGTVSPPYRQNVFFVRTSQFTGPVPGPGSAYARDYVQRAYIAYYGRPADPGGLNYWAARMDAAGGSIDAIIDAFGNSNEFTQRYDGLSYPVLVTNIYRQGLAR